MAIVFTFSKSVSNLFLLEFDDNENMQSTSQSLTDCLLNVKFSHKLSTFRSFEWTCFVAECVGAERGRHKRLYPGHVFLKCKSNCHHLRDDGKEDGKEDGGGVLEGTEHMFQFLFLDVAKRDRNSGMCKLWHKTGLNRTWSRLTWTRRRLCLKFVQTTKS